MPRENVELVHAFTEAFNARDIEAITAVCHPQVEFHSTFAAVGGEIYHGHEGVRSWHRDIEETWAGSISSEPEAIFELGDATLTFTAIHATGSRSGAQVTIPAAIVTKMREGLMVYLKGYAHREDALSDLSVSEEALEPIAP